MLSKTKRNSNVTSPKKSIPANQNVSPADTWGVFVSPITDCVIATFSRSVDVVQQGNKTNLIRSESIDILKLACHQDDVSFNQDLDRL